GPGGPGQRPRPGRCRPAAAGGPGRGVPRRGAGGDRGRAPRSEEHTSELQSLTNLVCRLLLEQKKSMKTLDAATAPIQKPPACRLHRRVPRFVVLMLAFPLFSFLS